MTKIFVRCDTGYCGSESHEVIDVDFTLSELADRCSPESQEVDGIVHQMAEENYQIYGFDEDEEFEDEQFSGSWEIFDSEKHSAYLSDSQLD